MATARVKATYSLDVEAVDRLDRLAKAWGVPKSEALRRAIAMAAETCEGADRRTTALLDELQRKAALAEDVAQRWLDAARAERTASARKREDPVGR